MPPVIVSGSDSGGSSSELLSETRALNVRFEERMNQFEDALAVMRSQQLNIKTIFSARDIVAEGLRQLEEEETESGF